MAKKKIMIRQCKVCELWLSTTEGYEFTRFTMTSVQQKKLQLEQEGVSVIVTSKFQLDRCAACEEVLKDAPRYVISRRKIYDEPGGSWDNAVRKTEE